MRLLVFAVCAVRSQSQAKRDGKTGCFHHDFRMVMAIPSSCQTVLPCPAMSTRLVHVVVGLQVHFKGSKPYEFMAVQSWQCRHISAVMAVQSWQCSTFPINSKACPTPKTGTIQRAVTRCAISYLLRCRLNCLQTK